MKIILNSENAYKWYHDDNIYFRGYFFLGNEMFYGEQALEYLKNTDVTEIIGQLPQFNGVYSIIISYESKILLVCDRLRGLPLFYHTNKRILISDSVRSILDEVPDARINNLSYDDYASSSLFVSGYDTLIDGIFQVQAAEYVIIDLANYDIERFEYFHYKSCVGNNNSEEKLKKLFFDNYDMIAARLEKALRGRTAVVPLSGGADSRMVVSMLKKRGYKDVICYTYGIKGNAESKMSKAVADYYGYPWVMVEYNAKMWDELQKSDTLKSYDDYATNYVSTTHIQDILAIKQLKREKIIPDDSVFIPGHSGDMIAGSHLTADFLNENMDFERFIQRVLIKYYPKGHSQELENKIRLMFKNNEKSNIETYSREYEWFNIKERQAKFIVNSVRAYEFIGHEWLIPLWDNSQFEFWSQVPIKLRYDRKLYFDCTKDSIKSTNDRTTTSEIAEGIRKIPFLNTFVRRLYRISRYYNSKMGFEHMFSFSEYMKACFSLYPTFTINDLLCNRRLKELKKELHFDN